MQVRRTEITTQVDRGDAYGYRVRFQGAAGESITVSFRSDRWLDDDDDVKRQAMAMMSDTVSTPGPLNAYDALSNGNIPSEVEVAERLGSGEVERKRTTTTHIRKATRRCPTIRKKQRSAVIPPATVAVLMRPDRLGHRRIQRMQR